MGGTVISVLGGVLPFKVNFIFFVLVAVVGYGIYLPYQEKRKYGPSRNKSKKQNAPKSGRFSPASALKRTSEQHDHIPSADPNVQKRLEQRKALKEAGLMDKAEYEQSRKQF